MNVSQLLRKRESEIEITPDDLFKSRDFFGYVSKLAEGLTGKYTKPPKVELAYEKPSSGAAYTDGSRIHINMNNSLIAAAKGIKGKFKTVLGILFHEAAHIIYTNFKGEMAEVNKLQKAELPGAGPFTSPEADEIRSALKNPRWQRFFRVLYNELANYADDVHDEEALIASSKWMARRGKQSVVEECIRAVRRILKAQAPSVEKILANRDGKVTVEVMSALIFQYIRYGEVIVADPKTLNHEAVKTLEPMKADCDLIATTGNTSVLFDGITRIVLALWPTIREQSNFQEEQEKKDDRQNGRGGGGEGTPNGQSEPDGADNSRGGGENSAEGQSGSDGKEKSQGSGSDNGQPEQEKPDQGSQGSSGQSLDSMLDGIREAAKAQGGSTGPQDRENSSAERQDVPRIILDVLADDDDVSEAAEKLGGLLAALRRVQAVAEGEQEIANRVANEVHAVNEAGPHKGRPCHIDRLGEPTGRAIREYNEVYGAVGSYSKRLQRLVQRELEDRRQGTVLRHRSFGSGLDVRDAYRLDEKFYTSKKVPEDVPQMAVCLLVDLSGSMNNCGRIEAAKMAAVLLYDFCRGLNIPCMVCGHNDGCIDGFWLTIAANYDSVDGNDKYRIMDMSPDRGNRDGMALEIASGMLNNRPEEKKILFILSDGQPAASGYGGEAAKLDIQSIVAKYRRRGVQTVATAIGTDKERIQEIYGECYLDIEDLTKLPSTLVKILKKFALS